MTAWIFADYSQYLEFGVKLWHVLCPSVAWYTWQHVSAPRTSRSTLSLWRGGNINIICDLTSTAKIFRYLARRRRLKSVTWNNCAWFLLVLETNLHGIWSYTIMEKALTRTLCSTIIKHSSHCSLPEFDPVFRVCVGVCVRGAEAGVDPEHWVLALVNTS